ncbi:MAG: hypothetical protein NTW86_19595 [Candidatus Sumerlaeota bacterium]|nr:hypothetical protein [Candidatus Sumerlaeota bacterium]
MSHRPQMLAGVVEVQAAQGLGKRSATIFQIHTAPSTGEPHFAATAAACSYERVITAV